MTTGPDAPTTAPSSAAPSSFPHDGMAPTFAWAMSLTAVAGFFLNNLQITYVHPFTEPAHHAAAFAVLLVLLVLQLLVCAWYGRAERRAASRTALAAQAVLVFAPPPLFQEAWMGVSGFLAGSALLVLGPRAGWIAFAATVAGVAAVHAWYNPLPVSTPAGPLFMSVQVVVTGLIVYGLTRFRKMVVDLHEARTALAEAAVVRERLRFARDLHDLLGYSLSALTLKAELAHRLIPVRPAQARGELSELLDTGRQALSDVRAVAHGYRDLSLEEECMSVRSVLTTAGVNVRMEVDHGELPTQVGTVVATVLRESATNLLRHSKAENCEISIREEGERVTATFANDGVRSGEALRPGASGSSGGLDNLADRAAALGGTLTCGVDPDGRFRVTVELPKRRPLDADGAGRVDAAA
ncbi:sensor histidine kinase [Nocardiopsis baichengensis]|uniref:sensor histidine kinase n=1 Tax=Nocardiopsis baichengensis TaxID=280240 RepID=UPI000349DCA8|nr:histidine kinase [Nocardiopsis baichengensis]